MRSILQRTVLITLMFLTLLLFVSWSAPTYASGQCYRGSWIGWENGHHFVAFETGPGNAWHNNWVVTRKPWIVPSVSIWAGADWYGRVKVGFRWLDWLPWEYFFGPWDFELCKR